MKQIIANYSFNTTAKTVTLTDFGTIRLDRLQLIVDTTTNTILYNFADSTIATATVATNVITLSAVPGSSANSDKLQIIYDVLSGDPTYDAPILPTGAATSANQTNGNQQVQGSVASASTDSGNPVKVGGKFNTTRPTYTDGQRTDLQTDARGNVAVMPFNGSNPASFGADNADAVAVSATSDKQRVINRNSVFNGTSWDRQRGDTNGNATAVITNGTNVADVRANDTGYNGQVINNGMKVLPFTTSTPGAQTLLADTDLRGYSTVSIHFTSVGVGLVFAAPFSASSGGNYVTTNTWTRSDTVTNATSAPSSTVNVYQISRAVGPFFQLAISALTSGTVSGYIILSPQPLFPNTLGVNAVLGLSAPQADGSANTQGSVQPQLFNGTNHDKQRANITGALIAAGATTTQTVTLTTFNARSLSLVFNVSAYTSGTINIAINGLTSSSYAYPLISSITGLAATGVNAYHVGVGLTAAVGQFANIPLPRTVQVVISGTFVATYGVDYVLGL